MNPRNVLKNHTTNGIKLKAIFLILAMAICFSCQDESNLTLQPVPPPPGGIWEPAPTPPSGPSLNSSAIRDIFKTEITSQTTNSERYIGIYGNHLYFNYERLVREGVESLKPKLNMQGFDFNSLSSQFSISTNYPSNVLPSQVPGANSFYSIAELSIMDSYVSKMYNATMAAHCQFYYNMIKDKILNSGLPNDRKIVLLGVIETGNEFAKGFFNGSWRNIYTDINNVVVSGSGGCSIEWRGVWASAVVGGVSNGVRGAIAGAGGGTVAFPGLGTATGAIAGGVFGFATGFIGSAVGGVAANLLTTCFRKMVSNEPGGWAECMMNHDPNCGGPSVHDPVTEIGDNKTWYLLN